MQSTTAVWSLTTRNLPRKVLVRSLSAARHLVLSFAGSGLVARMDRWVPGLKGKVIVDGAGHWAQVERPAQVNEALIGFLKTVA